MVRKPRFNLPGVLQHIIQRGNNREPCFFTETDFIRYTDNLHEAAAKNYAAIHAYVFKNPKIHKNRGQITVFAYMEI